jgi:hypothetical protein
MQAPPPLRLHWIPVEPSWLIATATVLLAALPHQLPRPVAAILRHPVGAMLFAVLAAVIAWFGQKPVLGVAMILLVAAVQIHAPLAAREGFVAPILVKDRVDTPQKRRWFSEEILSEDPHGIQERTEEGGFLYDEVEHGDRPWFAESTLEEHPRAIQERPVSEADPHDTGHSVA